MTYPHLTPNELVILEAYFHQKQTVSFVARLMNRSRTTVTKFHEGQTALEYFQTYKKNKKRCGRNPIILPSEEAAYIRQKVNDGWDTQYYYWQG